MWIIEKIVSKGDYNYAIVKNHPFANKHGYVLHHRIIMENYLGRILNQDEIVHHKNHNKKDNRIENLEIMSNKEHTKHHSSLNGQKWVLLRCPQCKKEFDKPENQSFLTKPCEYNCCQRKCSGKFSRNIELYGRNKEIEDAISNNLIKKYRKYLFESTD